MERFQFQGLACTAECVYGVYNSEWTLSQHQKLKGQPCGSVASPRNGGEDRRREKKTRGGGFSATAPSLCKWF